NTVLASSVPAASDVDSTVASYSLVAGPASGSLSFNSDGTYSFNPGTAFDDLAAGATRQVSFTYTATDNNGGASAPATVTITVTGTNDAPVASDASAGTTENTVLASSVPAASDVDGTVASYSLVAGPASGALTFNSDGTYSFNPGTAFDDLAVGATRQVSFTYTATDNNGGVSAPATVTITVTGTNDAPVAVVDSATAIEAGGIGNGTAGTNPSGNVLGNDTDVDSGDTKTVSAFAFGASSGTVGSALTGAYGALTLAADGSYSYVLDNANATVQALRSGDTLTEVFSYTVRDAAGATGTATLTVTIQGRNDAPVVGTATATLSEEGLAGANADTSGASDTTNSVTSSGTISIADVDASSTFAVTLTAPATALTSNGVAITWTGSGTGTLVGQAGAKTIVTATIDNSGAWTVTLSGPIDHAAAGSEDLKSFGIGVSVSDGTQTTTSTLTVNVEDDSPVWSGAPAAVVMSNDAGTVSQGPLGLAIGADSGASAKVAFSGAVDSSGFAIGTRYTSSGTNLGSGNLTYNGSKLTYTTNADGSITARDVATNTAIFTIAGDVAADTYKVTMHQSLDAPVFVSTVFGSLSGGNGGVYSISDGQSVFALSLKGYVNGVLSTVNTSANTIGVGSGQDIATGDTLEIEFNASTGNSAPMSGISVTADKLGAGESLTWVAYNAAGTQIGTGTVAGSGNGPGFSITTANTGGQFIDKVVFGAGSGTSYKLILDGVTGQADSLDQSTTITVNGIDADGDSTPTSQSFNLWFDSGTVLTGSAAADVIGGGAQAETLVGGNGNDILIGGAGNDAMTGGGGSDTFRWNLADRDTTGNVATRATDTIADFDSASKANGGDILDLRDLLQGETTSATLDRYLDFSVSGGTTTIRVSSTGGFAGGNYVGSAEDERIVLTGVDIRASLGLAGGATDAQIIAELINRGKLATDVPPGG
ncbi:MAG TPA: VCBS domain-containing protein, partial [Burkholderiaceae bacterium]|nr:VCBS domain-containing protein [Burkholderiaceae bacterium]